MREIKLSGAVVRAFDTVKWSRSTMLPLQVHSISKYFFVWLQSFISKVINLVNMYILLFSTIFTYEFCQLMNLPILDQLLHISKVIKQRNKCITLFHIIKCITSNQIIKHKILFFIKLHIAQHKDVYLMMSKRNTTTQVLTYNISKHK